METDKPVRKSTRGFASMDPEKQRQIARKGGTSVPQGETQLLTQSFACRRSGPQRWPERASRHAQFFAGS